MSALPLVSQAAGLGRLNVLSSLGEPFRAEIDLISTTPEELETLTAVIASNEAYSAQGITRLGIHKDIAVSLSKSGKPKVLLSSNKAVSDPYLDMLIQLDWASGRLQREYTVLLDPPEYNQQTPIATATPVPTPMPLEMPKVSNKDPMADLAPLNSAKRIEPMKPVAQANINKAPAQTFNNITPLPSAKPMPSPSAVRVVPTIPNTQRLEAAPIITNDQYQQSIAAGNSGAKTESQIQSEISRIEAQAKGHYSNSTNDWQQPSPAGNASSYEDAPVIAEYQPRAAARQQTYRQEAVAVDKHRTRSGDNLSKIARRMRVSGVSLNQMLVGLYEYNKDAFVNGNMNQLKVGKLIQLPSRDDLLATPRRKANKAVVVHANNWQGYRQSVASNASTSVTSTETKLSESGEITAFEPEQPIEAKQTKDVVKLSPGKKDEGANTDNQSVKDAKKEDSIAKDKALKEAEDRTAAVEKQIEDMQKLLKMKNDEMAAMEQKAVENNSDTEKVESGLVDLSKPEEPVKEVVVAKPKPKPAPPVSAAPVKTAAAEPTLWEKIQEYLTMPILGGIGAILLLLLGLLFFRNKRKKDLENFERGILTSGGLRANTVFGNTTGDTSATDTSFLTDFAQTTDGAMMDTNEVDPIAEAEVYMAYGREAQAEEILKDAIKKEPNRHELHLKLLEIYQERKDKAAFETLASEMYTTLGDDDPTWQKIAEMGKSLEPDNPLYSADELSTPAAVPVLDQVTAAASDAADDGKDVVSAGVETTADAVGNVADKAGNLAGAAVDKTVDTAGSVVDKASDIAGDVADTTGDAAKTVASKAAGVAGLATGAVAGVAAATGSRIESIVRHEPEKAEEIILETPEIEVPEEVSNSIEPPASFNLEEESVDMATDAVEEIQASTQEVDLSGISLEIEDEVTDHKQTIESALDVPEINLETPQEIDVDTIQVDVGSDELLDDNEVEIKLNLVTAYIDMDDKEGARELLEEVIKEGSEDQVMRAQMIKDSM